MKSFYKIAVLGTVCVILLAIILIIKVAAFSQITNEEIEIAYEPLKGFTETFQTEFSKFIEKENSIIPVPSVMMGFLSGGYFVHSGLVNLGRRLKLNILIKTKRFIFTLNFLYFRLA